MAAIFQIIFFLEMAAIFSDNIFLSKMAANFLDNVKQPKAARRAKNSGSVSDLNVVLKFQNPCIDSECYIKSFNDTKYFIYSPPSSSSHGVLIEKLSVAIILN